jgi:hypothetical protein
MDEDLEGETESSVINVQIGDVEATVAFSLIAEAEKLNQVSIRTNSI